MRRFAVLGFVLIVAAACASAPPAATPGTAPASSAPVGFETPEDAVRAYLAGVADLDVEAILATAAVDEAAEAFDFEAQADRLRVLQLLNNPGPAEYPFYADLNRSWFEQRLLAQTQALSYSLLSSAEIGSAPVPVDEGDAAAFVDEVDPARLAPLEVVDVRPPMASLENDERARQNALEVAAILGASDDVQRVALVKLGDQHYTVGFELVQYDGRWKLLFQNSSLFPTPPTGTAEKTTPADFEEQTSQ